MHKARALLCLLSLDSAHFNLYPPGLLHWHSEQPGNCSTASYINLVDRMNTLRTNDITVAHMMTSSNGSIFRVTGHLCREFTGHRWIPHTKASDAEFWYFFYLRLSKGLSKRSGGWWLESPWRPLWRHCNATKNKKVHILWDVLNWISY